MQAEAQQQLEQELIDAMYSPSRALSRAQVAQVARSYNVPVELADEIAAAVFKQRSGLDVEAVDFQALIKQIAEIESSVADQGLRLYKLQALAKRHKRSYREIMECFDKALLNQQPIQTMTLAELRARTEQEIQWLIPGWLPQGTNLLFFGDGGTGKTLMAYQWMESIVTGRDWNGYQVKRGRGLLVQCDEPEVVMRERMDLLQLADTAELDILTDWSLTAIPRLRSYIEVNRPSFILIDSLSAVNKSSLFSENDMEYARPILQLTQLCSEFNVTICLIHHSNAAGQARGTRAIHNSVSEVWGLSPAEQPLERILTVQKTRLGRAPGRYRFLFDEDSHGFSYLGHAEDQDGAGVTQEEKIRLWLQQDDNRGVAYAPVEIAESCSISTASVRRALQELWSRGVVSRRPSSTPGARGYLYFAPQTQLLSSDQTIGSIKTPIDPLRSPSNPHENSNFTIGDQAIGENHGSGVKNSEKPRSSDRQSLEPIQGEETKAIGTTDRDLTISDRDRLSDRQNAAIVAEPLQKGDPVEVLMGGKWVAATYLKDRNKMYYSKRMKNLTNSIEVEVNGNRLIVPDDGFRLPG